MRCMSSQSSTIKSDQAAVDQSRCAVIALGSNLAFQGSSSSELVTAAAKRLEELSESPVRLSSLYRTAAQGLGPGANEFCNAVAVIVPSVDLSASDLLSKLLAIEALLGRERRQPEAGATYASRTLDLDLIFCRNEQIDTEFLQLPHPRAAQRRFVLAPLAELWPDLRLSAESMPVSDLLELLPLE